MNKSLIESDADELIHKVKLHAAETKKIARKCKRVIQTHHISYDPEITVRIYKGEHWLLTQLHRRRWISKGFIKDVLIWAVLNHDKAIDLDKEV